MCRRPRGRRARLQSARWLLLGAGNPSAQSAASRASLPPHSPSDIVFSRSMTMRVARIMPILTVICRQATKVPRRLVPASSLM